MAILKLKNTNFSNTKSPFECYKDSKNVRPLWVMPPKISAFRSDFIVTRYISLLIENNELREKYNEIWYKVCNSIKKGFDSETAYNEKDIKKLNKVLWN